VGSLTGTQMQAIHNDSATASSKQIAWRYVSFTVF